jgi:O-antigen ligase
MAAIALALTLQRRARLVTMSIPPHIIFLFIYLAFAGATVAWAFKPEISFVRFSQQLMIVISVVLPAMLVNPTTDLVRSLFLCFAISAILNVFFVLDGSQIIATYGSQGAVNIGYPGYFLGKNYLGECAAIAFLLSLYEILHSGFRRIAGLTILVVAVALIFWSNSKTAFGLAIVAPILAGITLFVSKKSGVSIAIILVLIPISYIILSSVSNINVNRLSYILYGDSTLTGRTLIWDFAVNEIALRPLQGWGYQSFWLAGPDAPSIVDAKGWIKHMPNAHNGYYDTLLEIGYVGLCLLVIFLITTLHAIGRVAVRDRSRAWLLLSIALFVILFNFLESLWMRGFEFLWIVFLVIVAEAARYWKSPSPMTSTSDASPNRSRGPQWRSSQRSPAGGISARALNPPRQLT